MIIKRTVIDEGAAASMMSLSCWKGLGSPELSKSTTMLTDFDGNMVGKWTNEPCNGVDEVVNPFWVLTQGQQLTSKRKDK